MSTLELIERVNPLVTAHIWVGKMNRIPSKYNRHVPDFEKAKAILKSHQTDDKIMELVDDLKANPKIQWKDSIKAVIQSA